MKEKFVKEKGKVFVMIGEYKFPLSKVESKIIEFSDCFLLIQKIPKVEEDENR